MAHNIFATGTKDRISISKSEYARLKKLDEHFRDFWSYVQNLVDVKESREEVRQSKVISQEKLFRKLGF